MEMKDDEIVKSYLRNPKREHIDILAQLNDCKAYQIESILRKNGVEFPEKKKAGRPPKKLEEQKVTSDDAVKKDDSEELTIKVDLDEEKIEVQKPVPKYLIPQIVQDMTNEKIETLQKQIMFYCDKIDELTAQKNELQLFLRGEWNGKENKLHGEV